MRGLGPEKLMDFFLNETVFRNLQGSVLLTSIMKHSELKM